MPFLRFDIIKGRTDSEIQGILDASHRAILEAFEVPERDRYQIVHEHSAVSMHIEDTGLGIPRSDKVIVLQVTSRPRKREAKVNFYKLLCEYLASGCGVSSNDVVVSFVENTDIDWSFGRGEASFLTSDL